MTAATILIPTWRGSATIGGALATARKQTISDLEILVVGDGIDDATRSVVAQHVANDSRVRLIDLPKGANRGERNRHLGVLEASAEYIFYLADDDLLLPRHVENLLPLLDEAQLVQSANAYIDSENRLRLWPTDLSDPRWIAWHCTDPPRNRVSITGTAHTMDAYRQLARGWDLDPAVPWTDLALWRQFFALPGFVGATHSDVTTLQFPATELVSVDPSTARKRFDEWLTFAARPDAQQRLNELVDTARRALLVERDATVVNQRFIIASLRDQLASAKRDSEQLRAEARAREHTIASERSLLRAQRDDLASQVRQREGRLRNALRLAEARADDLRRLRMSRSWRLTRPLRVLSSRIHRRTHNPTGDSAP